MSCRITKATAGPLARLDPQRQEAAPARTVPRNGAGSDRRTVAPRRAGLRPGTVRGNLLPPGERPRYLDSRELPSNPERFKMMGGQAVTGLIARGEDLARRIDADAR